MARGAYMKIVIAIDSFKGSASSAELNQAIADGIRSVNPKIKTDTVNIADGGEGTVEAIYSCLGGDFITVTTVDLIHRPIEATYLLTEYQEIKLAIIESASVIGIDKTIPSPEIVETASTFGLGALVKDAIAKKVDKIIFTLGGSGTNDGGLGLLLALSDCEMPSRNPLLDLTKLPKLTLPITLVGLCDVDNPYTGMNGFSEIFGAQKGGNKQQLLELDQKAQAIATQFDTDINQIAGSGAAGGLGGAIVMLGGTLAPGFSTISEMIGIEQKIAESDLVITGEGKLDRQTARGKVPAGVATLAQRYHVPVVAICGSIDDDFEGNTKYLATFSIQRRPISLADAMIKERTLINMRYLAQNMIHLIQVGERID